MGARSSVETLHTLSVVQFSMGAGPTLTNILGIEDVDVDPQVSEILNYAAGDYRPSFTAVNQVQPIFGWTCTDLVNALTIIDHQDGFPVVGGTAGDEVRAYFAKKGKATPRTTGGTHMKFGAKFACAYLEEINAVDGQDATAKFRVVTAYNGTDECLVVGTSATLPASITPLTQKFKLGKVLINATNVDGVTGVTYRTGADVKVEFAGGDHRPTFITIDKVAPELEIRTREVPQYSTYYGTGEYSIAGSGISTLYLYKRLKNTTVTADATAEHIKMTTTAAFSMVRMGRLTARNNENAEGMITIRPVFDGTNKPVVISLASAVT